MSCVKFVCIYVAVQERVRGKIFDTNVKVCMSVPTCGCMYVCREGERSSLNNLPLCTSIATDLYHHHSWLRQI